MAERRKPTAILIADDDPEDRMLMQDAFLESRLTYDLHFVEDGEELMDYLYRRGYYADPRSSPRPAIILLDLNMPRKDGREALREIKSNPELRQIPILMLSTSRAEDDIFHSYDLGVNSFIPKPVTFGAMVELIKMLRKYWFEIVELPSIDGRSRNG